MMLATVLSTGSVAWEGKAVVASAGDDGGEKEVGGEYSDDIGWNDVGEGRVCKGGLVFPPMEGEEQAHIVGCRVLRCQKARSPVWIYDLGFQ